MYGPRGVPFFWIYFSSPPPLRSAITFFHPLHSHSLALTRVVLAIPEPALELRILMINGDYDRQPSSVDNNIRSRNTQFHRLLRAMTTRWLPNVLTYYIDVYRVFIFLPYRKFIRKYKHLNYYFRLKWTL